MELQEIKKKAMGTWVSICTEVRPSKAPDGTMKPLYLSRKFTCKENDRFELSVITYADPNGYLPIAEMYIEGHILWQGEYDIIKDAQQADFTADEIYTVTPMLQNFADILNLYTKNFDEWKIGQRQSIYKKAFAPFGLADGQIFKEYDLIYIKDSMMFWGARHIDGQGFDTEENRPVNLQIPMIKEA